ncbi:MAG TPA: WecB/TagA/CpsF family glycosyltransferase [Anaeromyxobacteraceae bacterium]|nr:WecB/TagA/CpsF family glycosyltransferase [Anaeromyxobacteraceae bacterium]
MSDPAPPASPTSEPRAAGQGHGKGRVRIGGIWVDAVGFDDAVAAIAAMVADRRGGHVFTPNVDHFVTVEDTPAFREAYDAARLVLADGQLVVWASRLLGTPVPGRVSGSDLVEPLLRRAGEEGWKVYLLGGGPGIAEAVAEKSARELGVRVVGTASPTIRLDGALGDLEQGAEAVAAAGPDLLLVAMGTPKQEIWIHHNRATLGPALSIGVGASFDFYVGRVRRAPPWVSNAGLEWLYRLAREPRRLAHRYLVRDPRFLGILARTALSRRATRVSGSP